jgi:hypothetical protein
MISRKQLIIAYNSSQHIIRRKLRDTGINHRSGLTLEEFREFIKQNGWPENEAYQHLAELAMKSPIQTAITPENKNHR